MSSLPLNVNRHVTHLIRKIQSFEILSKLFFIIILCVSILLANFFIKKKQQETEILAIVHLNRIKSDLERAFHIRTIPIISLEAFVQLNQNVNLQDPDKFQTFKKKFSIFTRSINTQVPGIISMQLAPDAIVTFLTNEKFNRKALGHDLLVDDMRYLQILETIKKREQIIAGPLKLIQGGEAIIVRKAIFTHSGAFKQERYLEERRSKINKNLLKVIPDDFWGLATVLIDHKVLFQDTGIDNLDSIYKISIRGRHGLGEKGEVFWGDKTAFDDPLATTKINFVGGSWVMAIKNMDEFFYWNNILIFFLAVLIPFLFYIVLRERHSKALEMSKNQAKNQFLSAMSHELRTPLTAIIGFSELMQTDGGLNHEQTENVSIISSSGNHLLRLIDDVLDFSKIESRNFDITLGPIEITPLINECIKTIEGLAAKKHVLIHKSCPDKPIVIGDRSRLKQVLINLLTNAIKYNRGGGEVRIISDLIKNKKQLRICVIDTGIGISKEKIKDLFQPFNRLGMEDSGIEGTGLGLILCREILQLMGGHLTVESTKGKGSCFCTVLPTYSKKVKPGSS